MEEQRVPLQRVNGFFTAASTTENLFKEPSRSSLKIRQLNTYLNPAVTIVIRDLDMGAHTVVLKAVISCLVVPPLSHTYISLRGMFESAA